MEESKANVLEEFQVASRFELVRNLHRHNTTIKVIEMAIKPQDFFNRRDYWTNDSYDKKRHFDDVMLNSDYIRSSYISWYPLIAACSYIRMSKTDPFAAEYIIPQLLLQWIRNKYRQNELFGIRYFSCASERASEMGFNYVFPVSGNLYKGHNRFCDVLAKTFKLTAPRFISEFRTCTDCEIALSKDYDTRYVY
jgi:hypothetical protein